MSIPLLRTSAVRQLEVEHAALHPGNADGGLMEQAGRAAADLAEYLARGRPGAILILAGLGNNGGDAYVCARHLRQLGHNVRVASPAPEHALPPDAALARHRWLEIGGGIESELPATHEFSIAVDGLLGIGLTRPVEAPLSDWIEFINTLPCPVLALDVPSGLDADSGRVLGKGVRATHTLTFIAEKPGLYMLDGSDHAGRVQCADLGLALHSASVGEGGRIAREDFASLLQPRRQHSHKGTHGSASIVGGAAGMAGAALLAGRAALHLGAGRVYVGMLDPLSVDFQQPELMLRGVDNAIAQATALGVGPGLGQNPAALDALRAAIAADVPLALDADALNLVAAHPVLVTHIARRQQATILTPHPAEAARLLGIATDTVQGDRIAAAQTLAQRFNASVVLKGNGSVVAFSDGRWYINSSGNAALASGGGGDVLLGMIAAFLAAGHPAETSLLACVHLHGAAADAWAKEEGGTVGMAAGEIGPIARRLWNHWVAQAQADSAR